MCPSSRRKLVQPGASWWPARGWGPLPELPLGGALRLSQAAHRALCPALGCRPSGQACRILFLKAQPQRVGTLPPGGAVGRPGEHPGKCQVKSMFRGEERELEGWGAGGLGNWGARLGNASTSPGVETGVVYKYY